MGRAPRHAGAPFRILNNGSPYSTGWPFATSASRISPSQSDSNLVHQFHRLDDAQHLAFLHTIGDLDERAEAGALER